MNAPELNPTPIIAAIADAGEATDRDLAINTGIEPLEVAKVLNHLLKSAEVEREKRTGEYVYWLCADARTPAPAKPASPDLVCGERRIEALQERADTLNEVAFAACRELARVAEHLGLDSDDGGADPIIEAINERSERVDRELLAQCALVVELRQRLEAQVKQHATECGHLADKNAALHAQIEHLRAQLVANPNPAGHVGYIMRAAKKKPRTIKDKDKARDAALSAIKAGAQRAEVFALTPVGVARKGVEWRGA